MAFDILEIPRPVEGVPIDRRSEIERNGRLPLTVRQGFPDLVLVHRDADNPKRGIVITVEAQNALDLAKRWSIPVYQSHLAQDHKLGCWVVVVSLDPAMSRELRSWADGEPPRVEVLLLDVETVSQRWLDEPAQRPTAAVLAGALHGYAGDYDAARKAFHAIRSLPGEQNHRHALTLLAALPEPERERLIGEIPVQEQHDWMDVERRSGTYQFGRKEGRKEGLDALADLVFAVLSDRNVAIDPEAEAEIRACEDLSTLQRWALRAMHVSRVQELLA